MADVVNKTTRSRMMSGIKGKNTAPEIFLRKALHRQGFRFRLHGADLPGKPDLVFPKYRAVLLVHGCFWHRHAGCSFSTNPASNVEFWERKFEQNVLRDRRNLNILRRDKWRTAVVWECELRKKSREEVASRIGRWLKSADPDLEIPEMPTT